MTNIIIYSSFPILYNTINYLGWYNIVSYVPDGLDIRVDCGVHHDDAFNFRSNNTLHIVKVLVAFFENDGKAVENQIMFSMEGEQNRLM